MGLIYRRPWRRQPQTPAQVNQASPLARGVVLLATPNSGSRDALNRNSLTPSGITTGFGAAGRAWRLAGGTGSVIVPDSNALDLTSAWTVFAVALSNDATGAQYILNKDYNGSNSVPMSLCIGGSPGGVVDGAGFYDGGWQVSGVITDTRGDNRVHSYVGTFSAADAALNYFIDGVLDDSHGTGAAVPIATATDVYIGRYNGDTSSFKGEIYLVGIANRAWFATEVAEFHRNPWQLFAPLPRSIWAPSSGGASHAASGTPTAGAATVAGTATHLTLHTASGTPTASAATVSGTAVQAAEDATGTVAASAAIVAGTATHLTLHAATGVLTASAAAVVGSGSGPIVVTNVAVGGGGWLGPTKRKTKKELREERIRLGILPPDPPPPVIEPQLIKSPRIGQRARRLAADAVIAQQKKASRRQWEDEFLMLMD